MGLSEDKLKGYIQRLLLSRMRILCNHGFFGLLLMHMRYAVDEQEETASTDGTRITFGTHFLDDLSDTELDFVMMHEIMHVVLQHCFRGLDYDDELFNIACDIVVNSNILLENQMHTGAITLDKYGEAMHRAPNGKEGYEYTAEEMYQTLMLEYGKKGKDKSGANGNQIGSSDAGKKNADKKGKGKPDLSGRWDSHEKWGEADADALKDVWTKRLQDAAQAIEIRNPSKDCGKLPLFAKRMLGELGKPQTDWRTILNEFVHEEIVDYSFSPPDRRFDDTGFFLPDFNEKEDVMEDILFMVDTSGSMSDKMITAAFGEVKGALDQFDGKLKGWLGFFDAAVIKPTPFANEDELRIIRPSGGGGTDFGVIFKYVEKEMEKQPASIIVLTDGYAPFPKERVAMGIPTLWLINNDDVTPPWGKIARIKV